MSITMRLAFTCALGLALVACDAGSPPDAAAPSPAAATEETAPEADTTRLAGPGTFHLGIEGMSCTRCSDTVRGRLETKLPQAKEIVVDHLTKRATFVLAEGESISEADCVAALAGMHYPVTGLEKAQP